MFVAAKTRRAAKSAVLATIPILTALVGGASAETSAPPPVGSETVTADNAVLLSLSQ